MTFLSEMTDKAVQSGIGIVIYAANNDALIAHYGTEGARNGTLV